MMRLRARHRVTGMTGRPGWLAHALAALDMDFAGDRYFGKQPGDLAVTRASAGYAQDLAGNWQSFGANVARRTDRGLLVESARTNSLRNSSAAGAGTNVLPTNWTGQLQPGSGVVSSSFAPSTEAGIACMDFNIQTASHSATIPVLTFDGNTIGAGLIPATAGSVWTGSAFLRLVSGSLTAGLTSFDLVLREYTSAGAFISQSSATIMGVGATMTRVAVTATLGGTTGYIMLGLRVSYTASGSSSFVLRAGWPQLEAGAYVTSPIRTTSAAQTRAADSVTLSLSSIPSTYTLVGRVRGATSNGLSAIAEASDGSTNNRALLMRSTATNSRRFVAVAGVSTLDAYTAVSWPTTSVKAALAVAPNAVRAALAGALIAASDDAVATPVAGPTRLSIGSSNGGAGGYHEGYIERVSLIGSRISNTELQQVTA